MAEEQAFSWQVDNRAGWPPARRPSPPVGPTLIEVARTCPLRACFEASPGYERRMAFSGRVGTAYHRTLQSFVIDPPTGDSLPEASAAALQRFDAFLAEQIAEADQRPREQHLARDPALVEKARAAVVVEALRVSGAHSTPPRRSTRALGPRRRAAGR